MNIGFWNKRNHDFLTQVNRLIDLSGNLERIEKAMSSCM